jgi:hypothetical protein
VIRRAVDVPNYFHVLFNILGDDAFVAGGAARAVAMPDAAPPPGDIDVFMRGDSVQIYEAIGQRITAMGGTLTRTLPNTDEWALPMLGEIPLQTVRPVRTEYHCTFGTPDEVIGNFSYTTEQFAVYNTEVGPEAAYTELAGMDTIDKYLRIAHVSSPVTMLARTTKYARWNYTIGSELFGVLLGVWDTRPVAWRRQALEGRDLYELMAIR